MAATHCHLGQFNSNQEVSESYIRRLQQYFTAMMSKLQLKGSSSQLLWSIGILLYKECTDTPNRLTDVILDDIVTQMKTHVK